MPNVTFCAHVRYVRAYAARTRLPIGLADYHADTVDIIRPDQDYSRRNTVTRPCTPEYSSILRTFHWSSLLVADNHNSPGNPSFPYSTSTPRRRYTWPQKPSMKNSRKIILGPASRLQAAYTVDYHCLGLSDNTTECHCFYNRVIPPAQRQSSGY